MLQRKLAAAERAKRESMAMLEGKLAASERGRKESEAGLEEKLKEKDRMIAIVEQLTVGGRLQTQAGGRNTIHFQRIVVCILSDTV